MHKIIRIPLGAFLLFILGCNNPVVPKIKGHPAMHFPEKKYQLFNEPGYPYSFEYPVYAKINQDVDYFGVSKKKDYWMDINFPENNATFKVTYLPIQLNQLEERIKEAYKFVNNHNSMANSMNDSAFVTDNGVYGIFYKIGGNVATPYQFFLTDSAHHFFRGSLYFDTTPNADSLAPVNAFIYKDLIHLVNTFRWK
jgi:gliding motility-associated lipoprotein GldD